MKLVKVEWKDAMTYVGDLSLDEVKSQEDIVMTTIGYLIDENEERIVICGDLCKEDDKYKYPHFIPKVLILKMQYLNERRTKWKNKNKKNMKKPKKEA